MAEEGRQKYDQDMAAYRQGNYQAGGSTSTTPATAVSQSSPQQTSSQTTTAQPSVSQAGAATANYSGIVTSNDYSSLLQ